MKLNAVKAVSLGIAGLIAGGAGAAFVYTRGKHISFRPSAIAAELEGIGEYNPANALLKAGNPDRKEVALTFDDGPHPKYLPIILKALKAHHVHATFFEVGEMMAKSPWLVRDVLADENEVGNHTMTHLRFTTLTAAQIKTEITQCEQTFHAITGKKLSLIRPPGFREDPAILKEIKSLGYTTVGYTTAAHDFIVKGDFKTPSTQVIVDSVMKRLRPGGIILLHDAPGTAAALPELLDQIQAKGYKIVKVTDLMAGLAHPVYLASNAGICKTPMSKVPAFAIADGDKIHH